MKREISSFFISWRIIRSLALGLALMMGSTPAALAFTLISNNGKAAHWPSGVMHFRFSTASSGYFSGGHDASGTSSDEFAPIRAAFDTWKAVASISLNSIEDATTTDMPSQGDAHNTIAWVAHNWKKLSFAPPNNALAVTLLTFNQNSGAITDADIYFNSETFKWAVVDSVSEVDYVDVQNIATHEVGHVLGLDHSSENPFENSATLEDATMYYASSPGETTRRSLNTDDTNAILSIYGSVSEPTPQIDSAEMISQGDNTIEYRVLGSNFDDQTSFILTKNSASISDVVSRFRTIVSSTEATVLFESDNFPGGSSSLIAMNSLSSQSSFTIDVAQFSATSASGGGGGGCAIAPETQASFYGVALFMFLLGLVFLRESARFSRVWSRRR